jgi:hypothetical protein
MFANTFVWGGHYTRFAIFMVWSEEIIAQYSNMHIPVIVTVYKLNQRLPIQAPISP